MILNLQAARNQPVYLLDELVDLTPVGVVLKSIKQTEVITLTGHAQSNTRISEFLHNIDMNSRYLSKPTLLESKLATVGQGKDLRKLFEFTIKLAILDGPKEK
jgi:type IV pilus assembly protein PilN